MMSERTVACIADGKVRNVIVVTADYELDPECEVEYTAEKPAAIGWPFDGTGFIPPRPHRSWKLVNYRWEPPTPMPDDDNAYAWDEDTTSWQLIYE